MPDEPIFTHLVWGNAQHTLILAHKPSGEVRIIEPDEDDLWQVVTSGIAGTVGDYIPPPPPTPEYLQAAVAAEIADHFSKALLRVCPPALENIHSTKRVAAAQMVRDPNASDAMIEAEAKLLNTTVEHVCESILTKCVEEYELLVELEKCRIGAKQLIPTIRTAEEAEKLFLNYKRQIEGVLE